MSTSTKPMFKPLDLSVVEKVSAFAEAQNVPKLVFPKDQPPAEEGATSSPQPVAEVAPRRKPRAATAAPSPVRRLAVDLPEYLIREIADRAHNNETTNRYEITKALHKAGFHVEPADLKEDGRRER